MLQAFVEDAVDRVTGLTDQCGVGGVLREQAVVADQLTHLCGSQKSESAERHFTKTADHGIALLILTTKAGRVSDHIRLGRSKIKGDRFRIRFPNAGFTKSA